MTTDIQREFDPNLDIPVELKNASYNTLPDVEQDIPDPTADINIQEDTLSDDDSEIDEYYVDNQLDAPSSLVILSQTVRTDPAGRQVVDVVIDVDEVAGAVNYEIRMTK